MVHNPLGVGVLYCLGFLFTEERDAVVLIEKARPDWQRGKFNGIGGHVEDGETPFEAMLREGSEEAGVTVDWQHFATMVGADWTCFCFRAFDTEAAETANGDGDEKIYFVPLANLPKKPLLPNLAWLIPFALDGEIKGLSTIRYTADPHTGGTDG